MLDNPAKVIPVTVLVVACWLFERFHGNRKGKQ